MVLKNITLITLSLLTLNYFAQKKSTSDTTQKIITIKGIAEKGVEAGCIILKTKDQKTYTLLNIQTNILYGSCLKITGYISPNNPTICMQGIPFYVKNHCPCNKKSKPKYQRDLPKDKANKTK